MSKVLSDEALDTLFRSARSQNGWQDRDVSEQQLQQLYDLMKMGPTAVNCCPARVHFVRSDEGKARLKPCLAEGNIEKSMTAPVVAIIGMDMEFYEKLDVLFPHAEDARSWYAGKPEKIEETAFRNGSLQGAYFIMAARSLGLDCGPMSGFDMDKLNTEFFAGTPIKANFICGIGYGDPSKVFDRLPRLAFDEACKIL